MPFVTFGVRPKLIKKKLKKLTSIIINVTQSWLDLAGETHHTSTSDCVCTGQLPK